MKDKTKDYIKVSLLVGMLPIVKLLGLVNIPWYWAFIPVLTVVLARTFEMIMTIINLFNIFDLKVRRLNVDCLKLKLKKKDIDPILKKCTNFQDKNLYFALVVEIAILALLKFGLIQSQFIVAIPFILYVAVSFSNRSMLLGFVAGMVLNKESKENVENIGSDGTRTQEEY